MREYDRAVECYRRALEISPGFNPARTSLATVLAAGGRLEEAGRELEKGLEYDYDLHMVHINLGILKRQTGDLKAAERHFRQAIEIDEYFLPARFDLVDLYLSGGDKQKARKELEAILKIDPANDRAKSLISTLP
jgi:tetratricopeptide (TPR) repeat protein